MLYVLFDYGLNVTICVAVGLAQVQNQLTDSARAEFQTLPGNVAVMCRNPNGLRHGQWKLLRGHLQTVTWAVWAAHVRHPCRYQLYTFLQLLNAATLLEVAAH